MIPLELYEATQAAVRGWDIKTLCSLCANHGVTARKSSLPREMFIFLDNDGGAFRLGPPLLGGVEAAVVRGLVSRSHSRNEAEFRVRNYFYPLYASAQVEEAVELAHRIFSEGQNVPSI